MTLVKVEGFNQYKKDINNGGVINTDKRSYDNYRTAQQIALQKSVETRNTQEHVMHLQDEINSIKADIGDIKEILTQLLKR